MDVLNPYVNESGCQGVEATTAAADLPNDRQEISPLVKRKVIDDVCPEEEDLPPIGVKRPRRVIPTLDCLTERDITCDQELYPPLGILSKLPEELIILVLSFVPVRDIVRSRRVCKRWNHITLDQLLWKVFCMHDLPTAEMILPPHKTWEWLYRSRMIVLKEIRVDVRVGALDYPDKEVRYMGDWKEGKRDGYGVLVEKNSNRYEGEWRNDKEHGRGIKTWRGGSRYEGEWYEGKKHGKAKISWGDGEWKGDEYCGDWRDDHRDGEGVYSWANGDVYRGHWERSKLNGLGTKIWANGDRYEGRWKDDERHGNGMYEWPSGNRYEGQWIEGKTNGYGVKFWSNGDCYAGEWQNDNRHGKGVYSWVSGTRYEGEWKDGKKDGKGVCVWADGAAYDGDWRSNFRHGKGRYQFPDGTWYEGDWSNNLRHGRGAQYWIENGQEVMIECEWVEDLRKETSKKYRAWDGFFLKTWDDQRTYVKELLAARKEGIPYPILNAPSSASARKDTPSAPIPALAPTSNPSPIFNPFNAHMPRNHSSINMLFAMSAPNALTGPVSVSPPLKRKRNVQESSPSKSQRIEDQDQDSEMTDR